MEGTPTRVIYNGIDLCVLETYSFESESVYDDTGTDYLFTKIDFVGRCLVNGEAIVVGNPTPRANGPFISYDFAGSGGVPPLPPDPTPAIRNTPTTVPLDPTTSSVPVGTGIDAGAATTPLRVVTRTPNAPALTHQVIRHRLATPRQQLFIFSGPGMETGVPTPGSSDPPAADIIVRSPQGVGSVCDARNGPTPKVIAIHTSLNDQTMMLDYQITTYINEARLNQVNPSGALLSNRFAQTHEVDKDGYTTVTTQGVAIFRTDFVYAQPLTPDALRAVMFQPVIQGFMRENVVVEGLEDATGVRYAYQDRQVAVNFVAGPYAKAASISVVHRQAVTSDIDIPNTILGTTERVLGLAANKNFATRDKAAEAADRKRSARMDKLVRRLLKKTASTP